MPENIRQQLAQPNHAFSLEGDLEKGWAFRPAYYDRHDLALEAGRDAWTVNNPHASQRPRIRMEALLSAEADNAPESVLVEDFSNPDAYGEVTSQQGVHAELFFTQGDAPGASPSAFLTALNTSAEPNRAWVSVERVFETPLDLNGKGLGLWVHGDGSGALLNLQIRNPKHVTFALSEHYVPLDFTGWRYIEIIDTEDYDIEQYEWPYSKPRVDWQKDLASAMGFAYPMYHAHLNYGKMGELRIALNALPQGKRVNVHIGAIRAIPHKEVALKNPRLRFGEEEFLFPVTLESGHMLEFSPPRNYVVYGKQGEILGSGAVTADAPALQAGENEIQFVCTPPLAANAHARVTMTLMGDVLAK